MKEKEACSRRDCKLLNDAYYRLKKQISLTAWGFKISISQDPALLGLTRLKTPSMGARRLAKWKF